jgi:hypothetical protein
LALKVQIGPGLKKVISQSLALEKNKLLLNKTAKVKGERAGGKLMVSCTVKCKMDPRVNAVR